MLSIWSNAQFSGDALKYLSHEISPHRIVQAKELSASNLVESGPDPALASADVAFGQPDPVSALHSTQLRWIHLTSAGYTRYDTEKFRLAAADRGIIVTNSSKVYSEPCAEHILAFMLANARQFGLAWDVQRGDHSWPSLGIRGSSRLMLNQSVVILGFGSIARRLVELLAPFSMNITALRRQPTGDEGITIVAESGLEQSLAGADHVVNILPDNPLTKKFVTAKTFAAMKPGAIFYNIGRGSTVDQEALLAALRSGHIAAAYLDVTDPEPLPPEHPLWTAPNCFITPHTSGGHDTEAMSLVRHFLDNLGHFQAGSPLVDRII